MFDTYTYRVPEALAASVAPGVCVLVPLGSREAIGYVVDLDANPPKQTIKDILSVVDSPVRLEPEMFRLAQWLSARYLAPLPRCLRAVLPRTLSSRIRTIVRAVGDVSGTRTTPLEARVLQALAEAGGELSIESLRFRLRMPAVTRPVSSLRKKGLVEQVSIPVLGPARPRAIQVARLNCSPERALAAASDIERKAPKMAAVLRHLASIGKPSPLTAVLYAVNANRGAITALAERALVTVASVEVRREPPFTRVDAPHDLRLSEQQQATVASICGSIDRRDHSTSLLFGVTASGKTEVYLRALSHALSRGLGAIVLLPEISLTTQVVDIFKSRLGAAVAVAHSYLSTGERFDEWRRISTGEARIVVGARSAIFAPVHDLGLVIVDEEHEPTYKQDVEPRYNAREAAVRRARQSSAAIVLGSATPSIESYYRALAGDYTLLELPERVLSRPLPSTSIVDLREEIARGLKSVFSERLTEAIRTRLDRGEQVILFQNRRAYSTFLLCRDCGFTMRCPHCAVALKFHRLARKVRCHHCDFTRGAPTVCPKCQSRRFAGFGVGTERVEDEARRVFPDASIIRMDRDTTSARGSHAAILNAFRRGEARILVGTQMIAKGLDFSGVTLVGIVSADTAINLPDFRSAERTFQLISQVSGRAGRGAEPGEVIIQTFLPEHYAIQCALRHDYVGFYEQEIAARQELNYPPYSRLISIVASDEDRFKAESVITGFAAELRDSIDSRGLNAELLGPVPCVVARLRGEYRWRLLIKTPDLRPILELLRDLTPGGAARRGITVDVDPAWML